MSIRQRVYSLGLGVLLLVAGYFVQASLWQAYCTYDLTCWYRNMPGLIKLIDMSDVLKNRHKVSDLINEVSSIYWTSYISDLRVGFSENQFTVSELIELLGEPGQVYTVQAFSSETKCAGLYIAYPGKRVMAYLYPEGYFVGVNPSQSISSLVLVAPERNLRWDSMDATETTVYPWQGFIDYCN